MHTRTIDSILEYHLSKYEESCLFRYCNPLVLCHIDQNGTGKYDVIQSGFSGYSNVAGWFIKK